MSRVIPILACGVSLAACSMSMPNMDFLKPSPTTQVLRIESDPPGADAQNSEGQSCQTPCELKFSAGGQFVWFALNGYQPRTVQVRADAEAPGQLQPNPVYAELQPLESPAKQKSAPKRVAKKPAAAPPVVPSAPAATASTTASSANAYPWPNPQ